MGSFVSQFGAGAEDESYSQKMVRDCGSRLPINLHLGED